MNEANAIDRTKTIFNLITLIITLPIGLSISFLLYKHVDAPSIIWILWIIQLPVLIIAQIINSIATKKDK